jgi:hypothetical protein
LVSPVTDRHKANPVTFRPPEGDRAWLYAHAAGTGRSVGSVLAEALAAYRLAADRERRMAMRGIPEEIFQISNHVDVLVAAARDGINVRLFACGPTGVAVGIAPAEARDVAAELIRLADEADALRPDGEPRPGDPGGGHDDQGEARQARGHDSDL